MAHNTPGYDSDLLRGNTDSLLLFLIDEHGQTYGYQLIKEIERRSRGYFHFREGTVYPALRKLENDGLILGAWKKLRTVRREGTIRSRSEGGSFWPGSLRCGRASRAPWPSS
jgi:DNA-binding PadR family transcriptional regulator